MLLMNIIRYIVSSCRIKHKYDHIVPVVMIGQSKINAFFKRQSASSEDHMKTAGSASARPLKRKGDENKSQDCSPPDQKKLATDDTVILSPEVKDKVIANRLTAKLKLTDKQTRGLVRDFGLSWFAALESEFTKPYFQQLAKFVEEERMKHTVYPPADEVFAWTRMTDIKDTKVVILGQDPYHGVRQAHGLAFSVQKDVAKPPSLENMFKELSSDVESFVTPDHGCLIGWAKQGVLLLNAVLTVRAHQANSHKDHGWEHFTDAVIAWLNRHTAGTVFLLWGSYAQKKGACIDKKKHHVLSGPHPSPLSAYRGFFGCHHFSRCNELLVKQGKKPIDWAQLP